MKRVRLRVASRPYRGMPVGYEFGASEVDARALLKNGRAVPVQAIRKAPVRRVKKAAP